MSECVLHFVHVIVVFLLLFQCVSVFVCECVCSYVCVCVCVKAVCESGYSGDREAHGSYAKGHSITLHCLSGHIVYAWGQICSRHRHTLHTSRGTGRLCVIVCVCI